MKTTTTMMLAGLLLLIGGILAFANPFAASLTVELLVGWAFLIGGAVQLFAAFSQDRSTGNRIWFGLWGLLGLLVGISLIADPLSGLISLTVLLGAVFLISGIVRLYLAWGLKDTPAYLLLLLSGVLSVLIGAAVLMNVMEAAGKLLGILLGIELVSSGLSLILFGYLLRKPR